MNIDDDTFAIVIPTCDRHEALARCLSALYLQLVDSSGIRIDVVVADDGLNSAGTSLAPFPWARLVVGPRKGPSANRNAGARATDGSWLAFIDDDVIPLAGWLDAYISAIAAGSADVLEGRVIADRPQRAFNEIAPINLHGGALWSCNLAIRRSVFETISGFEETFPSPGWEDTDLRLRLSRAGARTIFLPQATVCHPWRQTNLREAAARFRNMERFLDLHPSEERVYNARRFARGVAYDLNVLRKDIRAYRVRGLAFQLGHAALLVFVSLRLWLRCRKMTRNKS